MAQCQGAPQVRGEPSNSCLSAPVKSTTDHSSPSLFSYILHSNNFHPIHYFSSFWFLFLKLIKLCFFQDDLFSFFAHSLCYPSRSLCNVSSLVLCEIALNLVTATLVITVVFTPLSVLLLLSWAASAEENWGILTA